VLSDLFVEDLVGPSRTNLLFAGALHVLNNAPGWSGDGEAFSDLKKKNAWN
jgi:hypothetical protein